MSTHECDNSSTESGGGRDGGRGDFCTDDILFPTKINSLFQVNSGSYVALGSVLFAHFFSLFAMIIIILSKLNRL